MVEPFLILAICLLVAVFSVTVFSRRNGHHAAYPLWQFSILILLTMFSIYGVFLTLLYIILS